MRRFLSFVAIGLTAGAFVLLSLVFVLQINVLIPIFMFAAAFVLLGVVKRMPPDEATQNSPCHDEKTAQTTPFDETAESDKSEE